MSLPRRVHRSHEQQFSRHDDDDNDDDDDDDDYGDVTMKTQYLCDTTFKGLRTASSKVLGCGAAVLLLL